MRKVIDIIGNKYNRLMVVGQTKRTISGVVLWDCICDCGKEVAVRSYDLKNGTTKSCGCYRSSYTRKDIIGLKYGKLTVIAPAGISDKKETMWKCKCDCGNEKIFQSTVLISGNTKSCGCLRYEVDHKTRTTHGMAVENGNKTKLYRLWCHIVSRCTKENDCNYHNYGGRGIKICKEWHTDYKSFHDWAKSNGYKEGLSIDRIDNEGNYAPNNCRWTTMKIQSNNKRTNHYVEYLGVKYTITEISEKYNIKMSTFSQRIKRGYTVEESINKETNRGIRLK